MKPQINRETLQQKRSRAGRLGGLACLEKYGSEFFSVNGKRGGRPRSLTLEQIQRQQALQQKENKNNKKEVRYPSCKSALASTNNLRTLKRMFADRQRSMAEEKIKEGETLEKATVSPKEE